MLGTSACRFFDPRLASSITMRGHEIMRQTKALIESQGYDVIYGDTDSTFVWLKRAHNEDDASRIGKNWSLSSIAGGKTIYKRAINQRIRTGV